jgi:hypothetical protein
MEILELGNVWLALKERFKSAAGGFGDRSAPDRVARLHVRLEPLEILATSWMARAQEAVLTTTLSQR